MRDVNVLSKCAPRVFRTTPVLAAVLLTASVGRCQSSGKGDHPVDPPATGSVVIVTRNLRDDCSNVKTALPTSSLNPVRVVALNNELNNTPFQETLRGKQEFNFTVHQIGQHFDLHFFHEHGEYVLVGSAPLKHLVANVDTGINVGQVCLFRPNGVTALEELPGHFPGERGEIGRSNDYVNFPDPALPLFPWMGDQPENAIRYAEPLLPFRGAASDDYRGPDSEFDLLPSLRLHTERNIGGYDTDGGASLLPSLRPVNFVTPSRTVTGIADTEGIDGILVVSGRVIRDADNLDEENDPGGQPDRQSAGASGSASGAAQNAASGNVKRPDGKGVAGLRVRIFGAREETPVSEFLGEGVSDGSGSYKITVKPNKKHRYTSYLITVGGKGYETSVSLADSLGPQNDIAVAKATDSVPGAAGTPGPDPDAPGRGESFDAELIQTLPLGSRRSVDSLALLGPGVLPAAQTFGPDGPRVSPGLGSAGQFSSNGIRGALNNFLVDGTDNNDEYVGARRQGYLIPGSQSIETVASFAAITALYDSRFGKAPGAQVDASSKAGGSDLHLTAYGLLTDSRVNANNYFAGAAPSGSEPLTVSGRPVLINNNPGISDAIGPPRLPDTEFTAGGVLSGAVPGLKETFFASSFEDDRARKIQRLNFAVPTIPERGYLGSGATGLPLTNQAGNSYPSTALGDAFFSLYPFPNDPTGPYGPNTYARDRPANGDGLQASQRFDRTLHFAGTSFLGLRYSYANEDIRIAETGGAIDSAVRVQTQTQSLAGFLSSTPRASLTNTLRFSWATARFRFLGDRDSSLIPSGIFPNDPFLLNTTLAENLTLNSSGPVIYRRQDNTEAVTDPIGQLNVAGYSSIGADPANFPQRRADSTIQLADTVSWTRGRHTFTAGAEGWLISLNNNVNPNARPTVSFSGTPLITYSGSQAPHYVPGNLLDATSLVAAGLDPTVSQTFTTTPDTSLQLHRPQVDLFLQDGVRLSRSLRLNLGFRFSVNGAPASSDGRFENTYGPSGSFLAALNSALQGCILTLPAAYCNGVDTDLRQAFPPGFDQVYHATPLGYDPRIGLAWDPSGHGRTAIRTGWGAYSGQLPAEVISQSSGLFPQSLPLRYTSLLPFQFINLSSVNSAVPTVPGTLNVLPPGSNVVSILDTFAALSTTPAINPAPTALIVPVEPGAGLRNPTAQQFGLTVDQLLSHSVALSAGYVAGTANHLPRVNEPNATDPTALDLQSGNVGSFICGAGLKGECPGFNEGILLRTSLADPTVYSSAASSSYQSLQLQVRVRRSLIQASSAFTWSHSIDNASDLFNTAGSFALPQDPGNLSAERASSNFDTRLRSVSYFVADSGSKRLLLRNWMLSGILTLQTGQPFTVNTVYDLNLDGTGTERLNTTAGLAGPGLGTNVPGLGRQTRIVFANSSLNDPSTQEAQLLCQSYPCDGAVGRNTFRAAGLENLDLALSRSFKLKGLADGHRIQLRIEGFNALNRTNFAIPVRILEAPGFGNSVSTVGTNRRMQVTLRYSF